MITIPPNLPSDKIASTNHFNRLIKSLGPLQQLFRNTADNDPDGAIETIWVKPTSLVSGKTGVYSGKSFSLQLNNSVTGNLAESDLGTISTVEDVEIWNAPEAYGGAQLQLNSRPVLCRHVNWRGSDGKLIALCLVAASNTPTPCVVANDGTGVSGTTKTIDCTLKYNIKGGDGTTNIFTGITPINWRLAKLQYTAATRGLWWYDTDGTTVILDVKNEKPAGGTCP